MPTKWTPELDSILFQGVFEECKVSFSKALCTKLAERVSAAGFECSYKAVENRLYSWKKNVVGTTNDNGSNTPSKPSTPKTPASGRGRAKGLTKKKAQVQDDSLEHNDKDEVMSPSMGRKRGRGTKKSASYTEPDASDEEEEKYMPPSKRVKQEHMDDQESHVFTAVSGGDREEEV